MYGVGLNGTLISERASFNINFNGTDSYSTPVLLRRDAGRPGRRQNAAIRSPQDNYFFSGGLDYALTRDQVLRLNFNGSQLQPRRTPGSAPSICPSAPIRSEDSQLRPLPPAERSARPPVRAQHPALDLRQRLDARSAVEAPTIIVNDAFTIGGAQRRGGTHARNYWLNSDLDYVRGIHSMRTGIEVQAARSRHGLRQQLSRHLRLRGVSTRSRRARPRSYTRRTGDPNVSYTNVQGGVYIQDDIKIRKNLTVTGGVRYEAQTHVPDQLNFAPRAGFTWAPFKSGKTTLRGSWGMFYDWLSTGTYAQTLQVDGFRQRELNIVNPSFPDPGDGRHDAADQPISAGRATATWPIRSG